MAYSAQSDPVSAAVRLGFVFPVTAVIACKSFWVRSKEYAMESGDESTCAGKKNFLAFFLIVALQVTFPQNAFAYLDPATGSYAFQVLIATIIGGLYTIKIYRQKIRNFFISHFSKNNKK